MKKTAFLIVFILLMLSSFVQLIYGQTNVTIRTESISMSLNAVVAEKSSGNIIYPREYDVYGSMGRCVYGRGFIIASKDFKTKWVYSSGKWNELGQETVVNYFISEATPSYHMDRTHSAVELDITKYWKYKAPLREVDRTNFSDEDWHSYDKVGSPNMVSDQMVITNCNTAHGISLTQRAYAFWDRKYDDFIIVEYVFKNTGDIDSDSEIEYSDNKVKDCYIGLKFAPQPSGLSGLIIPGAGGWMPQVDDWIDYYSGTYNGEQIRVMYGWDGDARAEYHEPDDEGDPLPATGIFMSPQYPGMAVLHVDRAANDPTNDPDQPLMNYYSWGGAIATNTLSIGTGGVGAENIYKALSTPGFFDNPFDWDAWNSTQTETWNTSYGDDPNAEYYKTGTLGFGPYNFESIGDSVRIVVCYAVGSMGWENSVEIGQQWRNGEISETQKNQYVRSGRDSLFIKIAQVTQLFTDLNGNFDLMQGAGIIGDPPQPPGLQYYSRIRAIELEWDDVGAAKYRIYRRLKADFAVEDDPSELLKEPYPLIKELDGSITSWADSSVSIGKDNWYCVTAVNASGLESSKFLTRTNPASSDMTRGAARATIPEMEMDSVYVVPNPYHRKSEQLYGRLMTAGNIKFYGLPPQCRIRVYTQSGDLIAALDHELTDPPSSVYTWNMLTDSDQYIASGLYLFTVDQAKDDLGNDLGKTKVGKFIIIR